MSILVIRFKTDVGPKRKGNKMRMTRLQAIWRAFSDATTITAIVVLSFDLLPYNADKVAVIWGAVLLAVITWRATK